MTVGKGDSDVLALAPPNPATSFLGGLPVLVRNLIAQRQLVYELMLRDIRLKYRGSAFGYLWSLFEPLLMALVFVVLFTLMARAPDQHYTLGVVIGVITWSYFALATQKAQQSLTQNAGLIEQIYVPREVFGVSAVMAQGVMATLSLAVAVPFMIYLEIAPSVYLLGAPLGLVLITAFSLGVGMGSAPWNVLNRDVEYFFGFVTRAGLYLSPVMWSLETIPAEQAHLKSILLLNPLAVPMELVKQGIQGRPIKLGAGWIAYSVGMCLGGLWLGLSVFRRMEGTVVKKL